MTDVTKMSDDRLTEQEIESFFAYAIENQTEGDGTQSQWAAYTVSALAELVALRAKDREIEELRKKYDELIYAVASKFPNESRHETALRYIREREAHVGEAAGATKGAKG